MSNDLSVNMRRAKLDRKADDRRQAALRLQRSVQQQRDDLYANLVVELDTHVKEQGWLKEDMVKFAINLGMLEFSLYYQQHSTAYDGRKWV